MNKKTSLFVAFIVTLTIIASVAVWSYQHNKAYSVVNVGGAANQCECSKRLER